MITEIDMLICFIIGIMAGLIISIMIGICIFINEKENDEQ